jgi:hypothetical protein
VGCRTEAEEHPQGPAPALSCAALPEGLQAAARPKLGEAGKPLAIGLVADTKEPLPATLANLQHFARVFHKEHVALVVALGGLGSTEQEILRVLMTMKPVEAPLFVLPGEESQLAIAHAVAQARASGLDAVDLDSQRAIDGAGLDLLALPGYPYPHYLGAKGGCRYRPADVEAMRPLIETLGSNGGPLLLLAHTPPRGAGEHALDWALGGANVGDPDLARLTALPEVRLGAFAHVSEAGGRAWDGQAQVAEGVWSERLFVNVGAADSVPHELDSGGMSYGQAALVELADGKARFHVVPPKVPSR